MKRKLNLFSNAVYFLGELTRVTINVFQNVNISIFITFVTKNEYGNVENNTKCEYTNKMNASITTFFTTMETATKVQRSKYFIKFSKNNIENFMEIVRKTLGL